VSDPISCKEAAAFTVEALVHALDNRVHSEAVLGRVAHVARVRQMLGSMAGRLGRAVPSFMKGLRSAIQVMREERDAKAKQEGAA